MINKTRKLLSVHNLNKNYDELIAVKNLNFQVWEGEIFGLLGPNGAGKSTTLECILGTKIPDSGIVKVLNKNPLAHSKHLFQSIGVQFQDSHYPDLIKVGELCRMMSALYMDCEPYKTLLDIFSLTSKMNNRVSELSGGEKQKLSMVLALINNPKIVFLDELTTGLDPVARRQVWSFLNMLKEKGLTIVLTSHYMEEVRFLCDRILIMIEGEEVISGTPELVMYKSNSNTMEDAYLKIINREKRNDKIIHTI